MQYKNYLLALLMVILAFNYMDRMVLGVVLQDIKVDLDLSDTQLGFLSGIAFAFFYSVMGIPIARWADRGNRVTIISVTAAIWSVAVALCGASTSLLQLLSVRVAVAVGEAGCIPPAHSLIADNFTRAERPRAAARYMLGLPLALTLGYFAAGWLNELYGWRVTFAIVGLPGIVLALVAAVTLREPRKADGNKLYGRHTNQTATAKNPTLSAVLSTLWNNSTFRHLLFCFSVWYFFGYGLLQWLPTFFIRSHGLSTGQLGIWLAAVSGGGALLGTYLGGEWGARYAAKNERLQLIAVAVMFSAFAVFNAAAYLAPNVYLAFAFLTVAYIGGNMAQGPILATIQTLVPAGIRATALALLYLFANLIGMGLGPLAAGTLSDHLHSWAGNESLRYALLILSPGYFWAAWHLLRASATVARDLAAPGKESGVRSQVASIGSA